MNNLPVWPANADKDYINPFHSIQKKKLEVLLPYVSLPTLEEALKIKNSNEITELLNKRIKEIKDKLQDLNRELNTSIKKGNYERSYELVKQLVQNGADVHKSTKLLGDNSIYSKAKEMERKGDGTSVKYLDEVQSRLNEKVIEKDQMESKLPKSFVKKILDSLVKIKNVLTRENVKMRKMEQLKMISEIAKEIAVAVNAEKKVQEPKKVHQVSGDLKPPVTPNGPKSPPAGKWRG